jgi:NTE family protein
LSVFPKEVVMPQLSQIPPEADGVFEGGGVKGIAFAGAIDIVEKAGLRQWKNVAGTSAGAIVASLLAVGYDAAGLRKILEAATYKKFADFGFGGIPRGVVNSLWMRGLAPGRYFSTWLGEQIAESPLARQLGKRELTFGDLVRDDLPPGLTPQQARRARYRLRVIGSDISSGRMLVLPDAISDFAHGPSDLRPRDPDELGVVEGVRMSMSFPYLFTPVRLWDLTGRPHWVVDGGLLSNFPVWLFDSGSDRPPARPTWGFRLHGGESWDEQLPYRKVPLPFWRLKLARAMFQSATEAWDREQLGRATSARTVSIPTRMIGTTDFGLSKDDAQRLYTWGVEAAERFLASDELREQLADYERRGGVMGGAAVGAPSG